MQKVAFYSKWLDNSNGLVKDCPKNEMEQNETGTQNPAKPSRSTAGLLGRMAKGVVGIGLLVGSNAEAQLPTFEIYGIDTTYVREYVGGQWHETETAVNNVYRPGSSTKGVASYRRAAVYQECLDSSAGQAFGMIFDKLLVENTVWYSDGTYLNKQHYHEYCAFGQRHRNDWIKNVPREKQRPARYLDNKAMVVGTIETVLARRFFGGPTRKRVKEHVTRLRIEATHTSGVKRFTFTIKYRVEGSTEVTSMQRSVALGPGHKRSLRLGVPAGGSWATIDSITVHENRPPDRRPPRPIIVPVRPFPVPAPPSNPTPNPRRPPRR